jgi:hypothetical protein
MVDEIDADAISKYLDTQSDFDLEQFVYHSLIQRGIAATHGGTYVDSVTNKYRQYDIRATVAYEVIWAAISMAIECKSLTPDFPLVVQRVPRPENESYHEVIHASDHLSTTGTVLQRPRRTDNRGVYRSGEMVGKKATQIRWNPKRENSFVAGDSETYDKWSQALSSADALITQSQQAHKKYKQSEFATFVMPILIVSDSTLWVADYSESGQRKGAPEQVEEATLFVDREYGQGNGGYYIGHLHMFTLTGFSNFLKKLSPTSNSALVEQVFGFLHPRRR